MTMYCTYFGIDSHLRTTTICALTPTDGEVKTRTFKGNNYAEMREWMAGFSGPAFGVYESGCTGFVPARELSKGEVSVCPVASSKIPSSADSRSKKNDRRDAERLARLALAGEVSKVWVPSVEIEGLRDLSQAIADLSSVREAARQRVNAILCRHGIYWDERTDSGRLRKRWGVAFWSWLRSIELDGAGSQAAYLAALAAAESAEIACKALEDKAHVIVDASTMKLVVDTLMCIKGCGFITALAYAAEIGDFFRFSSGRKVTSYFGLAPSEHSSAESIRNGCISKNGCALVRMLLIECSWQIAKGNPACRKKAPSGIDQVVLEHARACSERLVERRRALIARGMALCKANAATAAELCRMLLYIGKEAQSMQNAA